MYLKIATSFLRKNFAPLILSIFLIMACFSHSTFASVTSQTWTARQSPTTLPSTDASWLSIAWAPSISTFAAVANDGTTASSIMISTNGIDWTRQTAPSSTSTWTSIVWSPTVACPSASTTGLFVAVARTGGVMTSCNGTSWTARTSASNDLWQGVTWSPTAVDPGTSVVGMFVAVSNSGTVMRSSDGVTWINTSNSGIGVDLWQGVTWSPTATTSGLFVAVGNTVGAGNEVMTSSNGRDWTMGTAATSSSWVSVTWSPTAACPTASTTGLFVAVSAGAGAVMNSCDGFSWKTATSSNGVVSWNTVIWSPDLSRFVAVGNGNALMTSLDGVNWTNQTPVANNNWRSVVWSPSLSLLVAVSSTGSNRIMTSPTGLDSGGNTTWTSRQTFGYAWLAVTWGSNAPCQTSSTTGLFAAITNTGLTNRVMTSCDGTTWTSQTAATNNNWRGIAWSPTASSNGLFVAVAGSGVGNRVMTSPDGINWASASSSGDNTWLSVVWAPTAACPTASTTGLFVAVGSTAGTGNEVMKSCTGTGTWTAATSSVSATWNAVTWSPEKSLFVAVGSTAGTGNEVMTSPDGVTWSSATSSISASWQSIAWSPTVACPTASTTGLFVAVSSTGGTGNEVMNSCTGTGTWAAATSSASSTWSSVAWSPELGIFTAVGNTGAVMTSPDGVNWTSRTAANSYFWKSVTWAPTLGKFLAVSSTGSAGDQIMTSDVLAPTISAISSGSPVATSTTITWTTDESASSQVNYSTNLSYASSTTLDSTLVTSHSVLVSGLTCNTTYNYKVSSTFVGQNTLSGNNTFTTAACPNFTLTYTAGANGTITGTTTQTVSSGGTGTAVTAVPNAHYHFVNWSDATSTNPRTDTNVTGNISVTANFAINTFTLTYTAGANGTLTGSSPQTVNYGTDGTAVTAVANTGYSFTNWSDANTSNPRTDISVTGNVSVTANFSLISVTPTPTVGSGRSSRNFNFVGKGGVQLDFIINNGEKITTSPTVSLTLNADPVTTSGYIVSLDPNFTNATVIPYTPTANFTLPNIFGVYTIYLEYFSKTGGHSFVISHPITYQKSNISIPSTLKLFTHALKPGFSDADVLLLQKFLNTHGFILALSGPGSPNHETSFYGTLTGNALIKLQEANAKDILTPIGLAKGTGKFGLMTLNFVNSIIEKEK